MSVRRPVEIPLIKDQTTVAAGPEVEGWNTNRAFEVTGRTASGSGAAQVVIEVRNSDLAAWKVLATVDLTLGTTEASDGFASQAAWRRLRARVVSISGTGAAVSANFTSTPL